MQTLAFGYAAMLATAAAVAASPADCAALRRHGRRAEAQACYRRSRSPRILISAPKATEGLELYQDASNEFGPPSLEPIRTPYAGPLGPTCTSDSTTQTPPPCSTKRWSATPERRSLCRHRARGR
jgi:hypothetical protein